MKDKVVIITGVFIPEPQVSARMMAELAEQMSERYHVTVLRPYPTRPLGFKVPEFDTSKLPYEVVTLDSYTCPKSSILGRFRESISMGKACLRYLEAHRDELALVYNSPWHLFGRKMVAEFCKKNDIPNVTPVQDIYPESLLSKLPKIRLLQQVVMKLLLPYDMATLHNADLVHTISEKMRDYLSKHRGLDKDRFVVVRNWQDERKFVAYRETHPKEEGHPFTFMFMGNVGALAGLELVIDAFVKANLKRARLVIAGAGSARKALQQQAAAHKECDIQFWAVPFGKEPDTQAKADIMLLPVKRGFARSSIPSKMPAYMFSAKPILASVDTDSDSAFCIREADAGWVCEPENVKELTAAMRTCYECDRQKLEAMGNAGFNFAIENFSRTQNLKKLVNACENIIERYQQHGTEE